MFAHYAAYGALSAVIGTVFYANLPTRYTLGAVAPTVKYLAEAKLKKINEEKDVLTASEIKAQTLFNDSPVLVMAVRRPGCALCRQEAKQLGTISADLGKRGVRLIGVLHEAMGVEEFHKFFDGDLYFDAEKKFFGPSERWLPVWMGFLRPETWLRGYRAHQANIPGNFVGEGRLLGGVYLINKDKMLYSHLETSWGEHADVNKILEAVKQI